MGTVRIRNTTVRKYNLIHNHMSFHLFHRKLVIKKGSLGQLDLLEGIRGDCRHFVFRREVMGTEVPLLCSVGGNKPAPAREIRPCPCREKGGGRGEQNGFARLKMMGKRRRQHPVSISQSNTGNTDTDHATRGINQDAPAPPSHPRRSPFASSTPTHLPSDMSRLRMIYPEENCGFK